MCAHLKVDSELFQFILDMHYSNSQAFYFILEVICFFNVICRPDEVTILLVVFFLSHK